MYFFDLLFFLSPLQAADDPFLPYWNEQLSSKHRLFPGVPLVSPLHAPTKQICQAQIFWSYTNQGQPDPFIIPSPPVLGIWDSLIQDTITNSFTFKAFPSSICPYPESHLDCNFFIPRGKVMKSMAASILHGTKLLEGSASPCLGSSSVNLCAFGKIQE